jgi:hypothetical protein
MLNLSITIQRPVRLVKLRVTRFQGMILFRHHCIVRLPAFPCQLNFLSLRENVREAQVYRTDDGYLTHP